MKPPPHDADAELDRAYISTGADVANAVVDLIRRSHAPGWALVRTGIPSLDRDITMAPSTVTVLAARPGHGKSMLLKILAKGILDDIASRGPAADAERVVYITLEEDQEKLGVQIGGLSYQYRDALRGGLADPHAAEVEAWSIAQTMRHQITVRHPKTVNGKIAPPISPARIIRIVERAAADDGIRLKAIFLDYLQLLGADGREASDRTKFETVTAASNGAKRLASTFSCPVFMAVQASREVDGRKLKIPTMADMQFASAIEQDADTILGLWRPYIDHASEVAAGTAKPISIAGRDVAITQRLMVLKCIKARNDPSAGRTYGLYADPVAFTAEPVDTRTPVFGEL